MRMSRRSLFTAFALSLYLQFCPQTSAQFAKLDDLTASFAKKLKEQKPRMVAVANFTAPDGSPSNQGEYFSWFVASSLSYHAKKLKVADRKAFDSAIVKEGISLHDRNSPEVLNKLAAHLRIDILLTGTVETGPENYTIHVTARRVPDTTLLMDKTAVIMRTGFTDSLSEPFPPHTDYPYVKAVGPNGSVLDRAHMPTCLHCPSPSYNDEARRSKVQGTSVFEVLISPAGEIVAAHPTKLLGYGLDEQAFEDIKRWRFKPATGTDGAPTGVIVMIEVTFHLY